MTKTPELLSRIDYAAFLTYSPRGTSQVSRKSRTITYRIKQDHPPTIPYIVSRLKEELEPRGLEDFLGAKISLIPAPRSAPLMEGALWPASRICEELVSAGLGKEVIRCVRRTARVRKSASADPGERPDVHQHLATMRADPSLAASRAVTVVDDVITKGATLLAVASHVKAIFPEAKVRGFGLVRTMGLQPEVEEILDPCRGTITYRDYDVYREP